MHLEHSIAGQNGFTLAIAGFWVTQRFSSALKPMPDLRCQLCLNVSCCLCSPNAGSPDAEPASAAAVVSAASCDTSPRPAAPAAGSFPVPAELDAPADATNSIAAAYFLIAQHPGIRYAIQIATGTVSLSVSAAASEMGLAPPTAQQADSTTAARGWRTLPNVSFLA